MPRPRKTKLQRDDQFLQQNISLTGREWRILDKIARRNRLSLSGAARVCINLYDSLQAAAEQQQILLQQRAGTIEAEMEREHQLTQPG